MKIGYFVPDFPSQTHAFFWREIEALRSLGEEVTLFSTRYKGGEAVHEFHVKAKSETTYVYPPSIKDFFYCLKNLKWVFKCIRYCSAISEITNRIKSIMLIPSAGRLRRITQSSQVNHIHGHSCANSALIIAMSCLLSEQTYSLTLHGGLQVYGTDFELKFAKAKFVSTVTKPLQSDVIKLMQWDGEKVPVISMGVDVSAFQPKHFKSRAKALTLISVSRLALGKGHKYTFDALSTLHEEGYDFNYIVVGSGPDEVAIKQMASKSPCSQKISFVGSKNEVEVRELLHKSDVLVLTSYGIFEAAPVCIMEAMAASLPVVCSKIGGTRDMVNDSVDGFLVDQKDVNQITAALKKYFDEPKLVKQMGKAAKQKAAEKFSSHKMAAKLLEEIKK